MEMLYRLKGVVLEEESDVDKENNPLSHYEMYIDAMKQCGANTSAIESFVANVSATNIPSLTIAVNISGIRSSLPKVNAEAILCVSLLSITSKVVFKKASTPSLTIGIFVAETFELDGGEHGPLALELISNLCGDDDNKWKEVEETAIACLVARKKLWDSILADLN